ncbi:MAG: hypothetical protein WCU88_13405 [Elusimicrobiota bacterium]|jgi:hypothetical protein
MNFLSALAVAACLIAGVRPAAAQWQQLSESGAGFTSESGKHELSVDIGATLPASSLKLDFAGTALAPFSSGFTGHIGKRSLMAVVEYFHNTRSPISWGLEANYMPRGRNVINDIHSRGADLEIESRSAMLLFLLRLAPRKPSRIRPFIVGGVGVADTSLAAGIRPRDEDGFAWIDTGYAERRDIINDRRTGLAYSAKTGVDVSIGDSGSVGLFLGWYGIPAQSYHPAGVGTVWGFSEQKVAVNSVAAGARFAYRF